MPIFTSYDGTDLWYEATGAATAGAPPLVALPGGPGADLRYLGDLAGLDTDRVLVRLDGRAAGRSTVPADRASCSFTAQAADVAALARHLGHDRIDLLGHSAGALVAQHCAAEFPTLVSRLVLVCPVGRAAREPDAAELAVLRAGRAAEPWYPAAADAQEKLARGEGDTRELTALITPFFWARWDDRARAEAGRQLPAAPDWLRAAFYAGAGEPRPVTAPTLVIAGALDGMIGTAPARLAASCHPNARLEIVEAAGHRPWVEQPVRFRALVEEFLTR